MSSSIPQSAVLVDAWTPLVDFGLFCGHKYSVIRALFSSTVILRALYFASEPFSEDSVVLSPLQRPQAVLVLLSSAFPAMLRAAQ